MSNISLRRTVAAALAATGLLHLVLSPEYLEEKAYLGVLFIAGGVAALALAAALWQRGDRRALMAGAVLAAGMGVGFVLSRTTGLPGFHESEWELSGLLSLLLEAVVVCAAARLLADGSPRLAQAR
jgi:hypothetical protein